MVQLVVGINLIIALVGFYVAWRIWQVRQSLASTTVALIALERSINGVDTMAQTTTVLDRSQRAMALTRYRYHKLQTQLRQLHRIFGVAVVVLRLWRRGIRR
jgi:hypothetical protein